MWRKKIASTASVPPLAELSWQPLVLKFLQVYTLIVPSIFAKAKGTHVRGYPNTFFRSMFEEIIKQSSLPSMSWLPDISSPFCFPWGLILDLIAEYEKAYTLCLWIGFSNHHIKLYLSTYCLGCVQAITCIIRIPGCALCTFRSYKTIYP